MMAVDNQQRSHLGSLGYDNVPYSSPHFNNPWTPSSGPSVSHGFPSLSSQSYASPNKSTSSRLGTMSMPYNSLPAGTTSIGTTSYPSYSHNGLLDSPHDLINHSRSAYEQSYPSSSSQPMSSYAATSSSYAPVNPYTQQQPQQDSRRVSDSSSSHVSQPHTYDSIPTMVPMSQDMTTPRNIYGREDQGRDSYGFPSTHSAHSSISNSSGFPSYYSGSVDGSSVTDYSSTTSESVDSFNSRTLPRPSGLNIPPAPQSMMSQFNSKVSSSAQKKHKCKICAKRFTRPSSLQTHMYSHTGEKRKSNLHVYFSIC